MKLKGHEMLVLLLLASRKRAAPPQVGPGEWEPPPPELEPEDLGVHPLPPNPLKGGN